ncbi:M56 family metallopeptidase [Nonlabens ponticola]|uniref:Peptidase M56 domain-containing protein n=1 Tax=Nonlabens ponticola TaxID=2496866 RepID=A0A3S9MZP8_9FLAO|nr:M56 family metallopeptidase [Nonlabens ponticola]AZQ44650.1 hypothetical protein EJ995_10515 [Nonlabens ponticola]
MTHLLHSCVLALLLYGLYKLLLKNSGGFQIHRAYLLLIPVLAAVLPFVVLPFAFGIDYQETTATLSQPAIVVQESVIQTSSTLLIEQEPRITWPQLLLAIYAAGFLVAAILFIIKLARLNEWIDNGKTTYRDDICITQVDNLPAAFSFLNRVYIGSDLDDKDYQHILTHELTHIKQRHSWDLLFYEILRIAFWFHPVVYLAQRDLKMVHEYIADEQTIQIHGKQSYYENLLRQVMDCPDYSFANSFYKLNTIKNRIKMIHHTQKHRFPYRKLLWVLPILFTSLIYTACTSDNEEAENANNDVLEKIEQTNFLEGLDFNQVDYYSGVSEEGKKLVERLIKENNGKLQMDGKDLSDTEYELFVKSTRRVLQNGASVYKNDDKSTTVEVYQVPGKDPEFIINHDGKTLSPKEFLGFSRGFMDASGNSLNIADGKVSKSYSTFNDEKELIEIIEVVEVVEIDEDVSVRQPTDDDIIEVPIATVPFAIIEEFPTYPGCAGSNQERKDCMQENISQFINNNYNTSVASDMKGSQKIRVQFTVGIDGQVSDIKTRAANSKLEQEAARVIKMLPVMKPGLQRGKEVNVLYSLPIIIEGA